jgi:hypothetical protein
MRRCVTCRDEADWTWQPCGPGETPLSFTLPGSHARGFPALAICESCMALIREGESLLFFTYKRAQYRWTGTAVEAVPPSRNPHHGGCEAPTQRR